EYHSATGQYYLHNFFKAQPDLNWRNPEVLKEFDSIMRFWLDKGVAGFRLDVFNMIIKDISFRDNPKSIKTDEPEIRLYRQRPIYNTSQPEVHAILKRWRLTTDEYSSDRLLLGESNRVYDMKVLAGFYGKQDELQLVFNLAFVDAPFKATQLRDLVEKTEAAFMQNQWPAWTGSNHDKPRMASRWAAGDEHKHRIALMMLLGLHGTPVLYYGDELGMEDVYIAPWRLKDPQGRKYWPVNGGRDRARTPMPWKNQHGAGFTDENVRPWLPYGDLRVRSVDSQMHIKDSTLQFSKDLIALRQSEPDLYAGSYESLPTVDSVWAWKRGKNTVVAMNFSNYHHEIKNISGKIVLGTQRKRQGETVKGLLHLEPWEGAIVKGR
ncbi:MAG TPA: alpha-amylase family glycosyl hydrolase, partial [Candidatus Saccharimonadia bacterium]